MRDAGKFLLALGFLALLALLWTAARPQIDAFVEALLQCCGGPTGEGATPGDPVSLDSLVGAPIDGAPPPAIPIAGDTPAAEPGDVLSFAVLAGFEYVMPDPYAEEPEPPTELPASVRALDGTDVAVEGYMLPIKVVGNRVRSFLLSRYAGGCCFGRSPMMNECIEVEMDALAPYIPHTVVRVRGRLAVGEVKDQYGYVTSVYRLAGRSVE